MKYQDFDDKEHGLISYESDGFVKYWNNKTRKESKTKLPKWLCLLMKWEYMRGQAEKITEIKGCLGL